MFYRYKKLTFLALVAAFFLVLPFAGNIVYAEKDVPPSICNVKGDCNDFRDKQGWKGVRCIGGAPDANSNTDSKVGRCVETPGGDADLPEGPQSAGAILDVIDLVTDWIFAIAMSIALIYLIMGAFQFITGGGEAQKMNEARQKLLYAIIGIGIALISAGFMATLRLLLAQ